MTKNQYKYKKIDYIFIFRRYYQKFKIKKSIIKLPIDYFSDEIRP